MYKPLDGVPWSEVRGVRVLRQKVGADFGDVSRKMSPMTIDIECSAA